MGQIDLSVNIVELIKEFGAIIGCISATIALISTVSKNSKARTDRHILEVAKVKEFETAQHKNEEEYQDLKDKFDIFLKRDEEFKLSLQEQHKTQNIVNKRMLANIIENTYYQNKDDKTLDMYQFKRVTEAYEIYHSDAIHGNSYISEIYDEMMTWERI